MTDYLAYRRRTARWFRHGLLLKHRISMLWVRHQVLRTWNEFKRGLEELEDGLEDSEDRTDDQEQC